MVSFFSASVDALRIESVNGVRRCAVGVCRWYVLPSIPVTGVCFGTAPGAGADPCSGAGGSAATTESPTWCAAEFSVD